MATSGMGARRPAAPVRLPRAHRVFFDLADGSVGIYWYRRRGQTPAMIVFKGATLAAALQAEAAGAEEIVARYQAAVPLPPAQSVRDLVTRYKAAPNGFPRVAASTRRVWSPWVDAISEHFGDLPIAGLKAKGMRAAILDWRDGFAATPRTADMAIQVLSRIFSWALDRELIDKNPAAGIEGLYGANRADIIVEPAELAAVLGKVTPAAALAIRLAAATGMRRGDLIDLRWNEVDDFRIERAANKSTTGRRLLVPLIADARDVVARLRAANAARAVPSTFVLTTSHGRQWSGSGLGHAWIVAAKAVKVDKHFNDLRGTACTNFYRDVPNLSDEEAADIMAWEPARCRAIRKRYVDAARIAQGIVERLEGHRPERGEGA